MNILVLLFLCHFVCDYTKLSTAEMLSAKIFGKPLFPIFKHSLVHAFLMTFSLFLFFNIDYFILILLFLVQCLSHFLIDLLKGRVNYRYESTRDMTNSNYWLVFGFDQYLHALIIILMYKIIIL